MDIDGFWDLLERSGRATTDPDGRLEWLEARLARLPATEIIDFQIRLDEVRRHADTWDMWGAAYLICDGLCSGDGFWYFQVWLIGLGRRPFELVVANPDNLASLPEVLRLAGRRADDWDDDEWPEWESLSYVASRAYERVAGVGNDLHDAMASQGHDSPTDPDPIGEEWDFEDPIEVERRLPRLRWMFPLTDRATRDQRGREAFEELLQQRGQTEEEFFSQLMGGTPGKEEPPEPPPRP